MRKYLLQKVSAPSTSKKKTTVRRKIGARIAAAGRLVSRPLHAKMVQWSQESEQVGHVLRNNLKKGKIAYAPEIVKEGFDYRRYADRYKAAANVIRKGSRVVARGIGGLRRKTSR